MSTDNRVALNVLIGLGSLLHDIEHDSAALEAHDLASDVARELALA